MERPIGEIFTYNGKKFEVVEGSCDDCCFRYINCPLYDDIGACVSREDGKIACFKLIK